MQQPTTFAASGYAIEQLQLFDGVSDPVANTLLNPCAALRPSDFAVRYGGEELIVMHPNSNEAAATMVAQRLCERMLQALIFSDIPTPLPHTLLRYCRNKVPTT